MVTGTVVDTKIVKRIGNPETKKEKNVGFMSVMLTNILTNADNAAFFVARHK